MIYNIVMVDEISIHAPLRERPFSIKKNTFFAVISIHAPLRERPAAPLSIIKILPFQSTLPYGSDWERAYKVMKYAKFQSTLPYGSDSLLSSGVQLPSLFQSTLPYGSDTFVVKLFNNHVNFNPRSLTGATHHIGEYLLQISISIHAPLRERLRPPAQLFAM